MYDRTYVDARAKWLEGLRKWEAGEDPDREEYKNDDGSYQDYWEWNGAPPDREYYRPWNDEAARLDGRKGETRILGSAGLSRDEDGQ